MPCLWILEGDSPTFLWVDWWHLWADVEWWTSVALKSSFRWFRGFHGSTWKDLKTEAEAGYQFFLVGMMGHFLFQVVLVAIAVTCFTKSRFEWNFCGSDLRGSGVTQETERCPGMERLKRRCCTCRFLQVFDALLPGKKTLWICQAWWSTSEAWQQMQIFDWPADMPSKLNNFQLMCYTSK